MLCAVGMQVSELDFTIPVGPIELAARLVVPDRPRTLVIIPLRSAEARDTDATGVLAADLHERGFATLALDLLTLDEQWLDDLHPRNRIRDDLLAARLADAIAVFARDLPASHPPMAVLATSAVRGIVAAAHLELPTIESRVQTSPGVSMAA